MIGFYDSGVGGLSVVNEFLKLKPNTEIIYLADTQNFPLGNKNLDGVLAVTKSGVEYLFNQGCQLVILACNTATSVAIRYLQQTWLKVNSHYQNRKVLGIVKPTIEQIVSINPNQEPVLFLATNVTCQSGFYLKELALLGYNQVDCLAFTDLAAAIELLDYTLIDQILEQSLNNPKISQYKFFVLACTHYPIIFDLISAKLTKFLQNKTFILVNQSKVIATGLERYLRKHSEISTVTGLVKIYITKGQAVDFQRKVKLLFPDLPVAVFKV